MATKKCPNGHQYDSSIYGDNCPFCPSADKTKVNQESKVEKTKVVNDPSTGYTSDTVKIGETEKPMSGGGTVIRHINPSGATGLAGGNRRVVGILVSYTHNPMGEVYKLYEGKNTIGRSPTCDIPITSDSNISSQHLLVLYREAEGVFWAVDQNSSNGTYINGSFASDRMKLNTNDVIVIGATKLLFLVIPQI